ncbi:DUF2510 domain-containing protein [Agromyces sp. NPDC058064]|uniref:DUF2510 domain-containing protein n=1 Tax=Agromyces sp. NPDC058064 TaxID=3346322 RepID=UPI0036DE85A1
MSDPRTAPAGWYPEPSGAEGQRWWDGTQWTEYATPLAAPPVAPQPVQQQPAYGEYAPQPAQQHLPYGQATVSTVDAATPTSTVWIWLIVALPALGFVPFLLVDWQRILELSVDAQYSSSPAAQLAVYSDPWYIVSSLSGWAIAALIVLFAYFDRRELVKRGFERPFHWAWAFFALFTSLVYVIGRSVVVRRRSGRGMAPMWAAIAVTVVITVAGFAWFATFMMMAFETVYEQAGLY